MTECRHNFEACQTSPRATKAAQRVKRRTDLVAELLNIALQSVLTHCLPSPEPDILELRFEAGRWSTLFSKKKQLAVFVHNGKCFIARIPEEALQNLTMMEAAAVMSVVIKRHQ
jgi:hypothetical protein